jgi:serine/threonine-protein kinase
VSAAPVGGPAALSVEAGWGPIGSAAQVAIATGDLKSAAEGLADAVEKSPHGAARALREHLLAAQVEADGKAPCRLSGLGRPRAYDLGATPGRPVAAGPPSIAVGARGAVVLWTDAHDPAGNHAFSAPLDEALRDVGDPVDVTPEGTAIGRPQLTPVGDRFILSYWDAKGPEAGVAVRWLDAQGRIAGPAVRVSAAKGFPFFPAVARADEGWVFVAWSDESDGGSEDLFLRRLGPALDPVGDALRLTDLVSSGAARSRARLPALASAGGALQLVYRLERDPQRLVQAMRILPSMLEKGLGPRDTNARSAVPLPAGRAPAKVDRTLAEATLVNGDRARADGPAMACGGGSCFVVWHGDPGTGGTSAALLDPTTGKPIWRKRFSASGTRPAVAARPDGGAQIAWLEGGFVTTASIGQEGVGAPSRVARVTGDQPAPSIAPGRKPGEWYLAWLHFEAGHLEPFAARIQCR